jgi:hypothetical protein
LIYNIALAYEKIDHVKAEKYWRKYLEISPVGDQDRKTAKWYIEN